MILYFKMNPLYPRMLCAMFCCGEKDKKYHKFRTSTTMTKYYMFMTLIMKTKTMTTMGKFRSEESSIEPSARVS